MKCTRTNSVPAAVIAMLLACSIQSSAALTLQLPEVESLTAPEPGIEERCGGFNTKVAMPDGDYNWCNLALNYHPGMPTIGLSFGIFTWDTWSEVMSHRGVQTYLYDCFQDVDSFAPKLPKYGIKPVRYTSCLGPKTELLTYGAKKDLQFKSYADSIDLSTKPPLSVYLKIDIEGSDWAVFNTMSEEDWAKIVIFDVEVHFCMKSHDIPFEDYKETIYKQLALWRKMFYVTGRAGFKLTDSLKRGLTGTWADAGCSWSLDGRIEMMTLSYVNKAVFDAMNPKTDTVIKDHRGSVAAALPQFHPRAAASDSIKETLTRHQRERASMEERQEKELAGILG